MMMLDVDEDSVSSSSEHVMQIDCPPTPEVLKSEPDDHLVVGKNRVLKTDAKDEDEQYNTMSLLELAQCVQNNQDAIEYTSEEVTVNPKTGLMVCLLCFKDMESNMISDHMRNVHNYRRMLFKCRICENTFQERKLLLIHKKECLPPPKKAKRRTFQQIMREVESSLDTNSYEIVTCPICLLEMAKYSLKEHLVSAHSKPGTALSCARCQKNFKSRLTLREHVRLVHEAVEDSVACDVCGQKFRSYKYLSNHKRNVHPSGGQVHQCATCGKQFKSRLCLHQHCKYVHPPESASVRCPQCGKLFKSSINLHQHLRVSHSIRLPT
ncbi:zinc finger protein 157-like [Battus philenor]|uniref:zinc finger protein 157-like n=1 Tax=Battus philenor TaxID=42288 RepID=UPI0035CF8156